MKSSEFCPGEPQYISLPHSQIVVGKTDNADAAAAVLNEVKFPVIILGTPRKGEMCRLDIFREASKTDCPIIALFPRLEDTRQDGAESTGGRGIPGQKLQTPWCSH